MKPYRWMISYILISSSAVVLAFYLSSSLMGESHAQEGPPPVVDSAQPNNGNPLPNGGPPPPPGDLPPPGTPPPGGPPPGAENTQNQPPGPRPGVPPEAHPNAGQNPGTIPDQLMEGDPAQLPVQGTAIVTPTDEFVFDPTGIRDPFKPYRPFKPQSADKGKEVIDPLQNLDIESLELVAVLWDVHNPRALVRPKGGGTLYTVKRNTRVGRNNGVVAGIREGEVIILETIEEEGRTFKQYASLRMGSKLEKITE